jgi:hypothetical protein
MKKVSTDLLALFSSPEFQSYVEQNILRPILSKVFHHLYPYIMAFILLWAIMFLSTIIILVILLRARVK